MLDDQIKFLDETSMRDLGGWLHRKYLACATRKKEAEEELDKHKKEGRDIPLLREEWKKQVTAQTKPIPSM